MNRELVDLHGQPLRQSMGYSGGGKADLMVGGEVSDYHGTMSQIRIVYNGHNHRGDSGGSTGQPGQQM